MSIVKIIEDYKSLLESFEKKLEKIWQLNPMGRYPEIIDVDHTGIIIRYDIARCGCCTDTESLCWPLSYFDGSMTPEQVVEDLKNKEAEADRLKKEKEELEKIQKQKDSQERKRKEYERLKKEFEG